MISEDLSEVLSEFARTMLTDFPIQGILDHLVKRIVDIMPVTGAGVTLIGADLDPRYVTASNASALRFEQLQTDLGEGPCLAVYKSGGAIEVPDLRTETRFARFSPRALDAGLAAVFTFPLHHGDQRLGALDLYRDTPGPLAPDAMSAAQTLADVAAAYLINAQGRSEMQASAERSAHAVLHDALTGLPNRVLMLELLDQASRRRHRSGKLSAVFFLDLDRFKAVNDTYGHQVGDSLLVAVAQRLTGVLRPGDSLARVAGDEFVALCENLTDPAEAHAIAARFDAALADSFVVADIAMDIRASIGIAFTGRAEDSPEQLLQAADLAMYRVKRQRGGGPQMLDLSELLHAEEQAELERMLPRAVERGELQLAYQPIVATADGQLIAVEALLRWKPPSRGVIAPTVLIPLAEQTGQIIDIGKWVLQQAWSDRHRWHGEQTKNLAVAVNVSAHQLMSAGFTDTVADVLDSTAIDPHLLTLEVTESVFVRDGERALVVLNDIRAMGVSVALDDFGTGYSSLGYLRRFPVNMVKVDRQFVANLEHDSASRIIVTAVIQLAHGLGMTVISEGVETAEQHRALTDLGCDSCQGFYFAPPMSPSELEMFLRRPVGNSGRLSDAPRSIDAPG